MNSGTGTGGNNISRKRTSPSPAIPAGQVKKLVEK